MEEDADSDIADIEALNYDDLDSVSKLQQTQRYIDIMQVDRHLKHLISMFFNVDKRQPVSYSLIFPICAI